MEEYDPQTTRYSPTENDSNDSSPRVVGYSIASMILGILSILCCGACLPSGVLAVLFACIYRAKNQKFNGMALAGLVTGIIGLIFLLVAFIVEGINGSITNGIQNYIPLE